MAQLKESPSQTAGPYVHIGCTPNSVGMTGVYDKDLGMNIGLDGETVTISGAIYDGDGDPVTDAMLEVFQANAQGRLGHDSGWARRAVDMETGLFAFDTVKPGPVDGHSPFIAFWIVARGINFGLHTRLYFPDASSDDDPFLSQIDPARRDTLIATEADNGYRFDIHLQGPRETVFFDI